MKYSRAIVIRVALLLAFTGPNVTAQALAVTGVVHKFFPDARLAPGVPATIRYTPADLVIDGSTLSVSVGGWPSLVHGYGNGEVYIVLPREPQPGPTTLVMTANGGSSAPFPITLQPHAPVIFTPSCPAPWTDAAALGGFGFGATVSPVPTETPDVGWINTAEKPRITVGERDAEVIYSVLAHPNYGTYLVSFKPPSGLADGEYPLTMTVGGETSNTVTLAVGAKIGSAVSSTAGLGWVAEGPVAPESIVSLVRCGEPLAEGRQTAMAGDPPTSLRGTTITVKDAAGVERQARIHYISVTQAHFVVPAGTADGEATLTIQPANGAVTTAKMTVERVAPGIFAIGAWTPYAAAQIVRIRGESRTLEPVLSGSWDDGFEPIAIDLGPETDQVYLQIFGTGLRFRNSLANVSMKIGDMDVPVEYAGPQGEIVGMDQVNVKLPRSLAGMGAALVELTVDGKLANVTSLIFK